jgi:uncharacterized protein (TIGR03086 family)
MDVAMFDRAVQATGAVVTGISAEQLDGPSPCTEWSVRDLLNHLIGQYEAVATGAAGEVLKEERDYTSEDHVAAYYAASVRARDALSAPDALEKKFAMPWGETPGRMLLGLTIADTAVHGADLAKATGQGLPIADDVAEAVYGMTTKMLQPGGDFPRGDSFADPVEVPEDAPIQHKLLAYLGRRP